MLLRTTGLLTAALLALAGCAGVAPSLPDAGAPGNGRPLPAALPVPEAFERAVAAGTRTTTGVPGPAYWTQEAAYTMTARLFPDERRLEGTARIVYRNHAPDTLGTLHLELAMNLHREGAPRNVPAEVTGGVALARVAVDGAALAEGGEGPRYTVDATHLTLVPPRPLPPGGAAEIEVDWSFVIPKEGAAGRMGYDTDLFFLAYWYPAMRVYDDVEGWSTDPFLGLAEFYGGFADYDVTVEAPAGWVVWATGTLHDEASVLAPDVLARLRRAEHSDTPVQVAGPDDFGRATAAADTVVADTAGRLRWRFTADDVRDFAFAATRGSVWEAARTPVGDRDGDGVVDSAVVHTFYRPTAPRWAQVTRYQQHALTFFSRFTGYPYPWPHMTAVEGAGIIGGGMEYPMMTLIGPYNAEGDTALYNVTAHELAHMWIPMLVGTDERRYGWLDEGTTSFNENQARKDIFPGVDHDLGDQALYTSVARQGNEGPLMTPSDHHRSGLAFTVASYMKPSAVLSALRSLLGEETFLRAYHAFVDTWAYRHPYPYDFFNTFEREAGRDLDWFWRTWYFETATLDQAVAAVRPGGATTTITVRNEGTAPMPVDLVVTLADGQTLRREIPVDAWLRGDREATVTVDTPSPATRVEIDPELDFPDVDRRNNVWTR